MQTGAMIPTTATWELTKAPEEFSKHNSPAITTEEVPACPVCRNLGFSEFSVGFDYEMLTCSNPWRFVQCSACGHVWLNPRPAVAELSVIYPPTYYAYNYGQINPVARGAKELLDRRKMRRIVGMCGTMPRTYLDVGCGDGRYLKTLEKMGVPRHGLFGLELDPSVVDRLRRNGYAGVHCERAEDSSSIPDGSLDLATMFHVIEHVDNPGAVLARIHRWLSPGGVLVLETPNFDSLDARIFKRAHWGGYHIPRHWNLFTRATISRLAAENRFDVSAVLFQTGHSFWMYSLHHVVRYSGKSRPRLGKWFDPVKSLFGIAGFTAFDLLRASLGFKTSAMLVICRKRS
jgi:SAM-dependent methyltransferase